MRVKWGMMITDGRGKLGGHVASKNRGGSYVRTLVTPTNPRTVLQQSIRASFGYFAKAWAGLTDADRAQWKEFADLHPRKNSVGNDYTLSASAMFQSAMNNRRKVGATSILDAPIGGSIPVEITGVVADLNIVESSANITLLHLASTEISNYRVLVRVTPQLPAGVEYYSNKMRDLQYQALNPSGTTDIDIYANYVARFGAVSATSRIFFQVVLVDLNTGLSSLVAEEQLSVITD